MLNSASVEIPVKSRARLNGRRGALRSSFAFAQEKKVSVQRVAEAAYERRNDERNFGDVMGELGLGLSPREKRYIELERDPKARSLKGINRWRWIAKRLACTVDEVRKVKTQVDLFFQIHALILA